MTNEELAAKLDVISSSIAELKATQAAMQKTLMEELRPRIFKIFRKLFGMA